MKTIARTLTILSTALLFTTIAFGDDPSSFPSSGLDAKSLGRGGTAIATIPGVSSTFGNPATLTPDGYYILGLEYLDPKGAPNTSLGLSVVDTSSSIRGALSYYRDPEFADFQKELWGIAFSQILMPSFYLGESIHLGEYEPTASPGSKEKLYAADAGLLYKLGDNVSIGYVAHNLFSSDRDVLEKYSGVGIGMMFPMSIYFTADYEEDPILTGESNLRTGIEFNPIERITGRFGFQDRADGSTYLSAGITYTDANGSLDAAILYNDETDKTDTVAFGLSMGM